MSDTVDAIMRKVESGVKPVAAGTLRIGQSAAGLVGLAASYSQREAAKAKPVPEPPKIGWKDIPKTVWNALWEKRDPELERRRMMEMSQRLHKQIAPAVAKIKSEADQDYDFAEKEASKIEGMMGPTGKMIAKGVEMSPQLAMAGPSRAKAAANLIYQTAASVGKAKSTDAAGPSIASSLLVPSNSKAANVAQNVIENGIDAAKGLYQSFAKKKTAVAAK